MCMTWLCHLKGYLYKDHISNELFDDYTLVSSTNCIRVTANLLNFVFVFIFSLGLERVCQQTVFGWTASSIQSRRISCVVSLVATDQSVMLLSTVHWAELLSILITWTMLHTLSMRWGVESSMARKSRWASTQEFTSVKPLFKFTTKLSRITHF